MAASMVDRLIVNFDRALRTLGGAADGTGRGFPAAQTREARLTEPARRHAAGLMRVNHAGEVAAQALYHGQSFAARSGALRSELEHAAREESDHLCWCRQRLDELGARPSRLDPLWYAGAFTIGAAAGLVGDRFSLGFLAETERQVVDHLESHLRRLPDGDARSRAVLRQMRDDEAEHAQTAIRGGGVQLPRPVRGAMRCASKVMTGAAYWL